ncbi:MAG: hypothetical protein Q4C20_12265 [Erysipelotrichaceae bacterium]|jgi:hypothetical protein|nr:hypothetical protein [Erysipelotrichaceae bacterium]
MSSIAYVTDESMLEYHRLCRNRSILFWRLSSKRKFTDFHKGDLLFFFARPRSGRRKAFLGYAHFDSVVRLSLKQMWSRYTQATGYDSEILLKEAIEKAAKGEIPKQMSCLNLKDVVFFLSPIYPEEAGLDIQNNLESYCYLDRSDPSVTFRILKIAEERGIDLWSADGDTDIEQIFLHDEIRHEVAVIHKNLGKSTLTKKEFSRAARLAREQCEKEDWEMIRTSRTDCLCIKDGQFIIGLPFVAQTNDKDLRIREIAGRMMIYRMKFLQAKLAEKVTFDILGDNIPEEVAEITEHINNEQI